MFNFFKKKEKPAPSPPRDRTLRVSDLRDALDNYAPYTGVYIETGSDYIMPYPACKLIVKEVMQLRLAIPGDVEYAKDMSNRTPIIDAPKQLAIFVGGLDKIGTVMNQYGILNHKPVEIHIVGEETERTITVQDILDAVAPYPDDMEIVIPRKDYPPISHVRILMHGWRNTRLLKKGEPGYIDGVGNKTDGGTFVNIRFRL